MVVFILIIKVIIITFISIFLSSLTMVIAMSVSPYAPSKKTKSCYNMRQFYYEAQQNTHPFLLDSKMRLVDMEDLLERKARMKALYIKQIETFFAKNLAVFVVEPLPLTSTAGKFLARLFTDLLKQIRRQKKK